MGGIIGGLGKFIATLGAFKLGNDPCGATNVGCVGKLTDG